MKTFYLSLAIILFFSGCGESDDPQSTGVHFQGRDCLSCHNKDLTFDSHLSIGGTVYKSATSDANNLNEACSERLHIEFGSAALSTKDYNNVNAAGFNGRGNVFALLKDMPVSGSYFMRIVRDDGTVLGTSTIAHPYMGGFDENNPSDDQNRYSCNTCHQAPPNNLNGAAGLLFTNVIGCN